MKVKFLTLHILVIFGPMISTIGYEGAKPDDFVSTLQLVDVRIDLVPVLLEKNLGVLLRYPLVVGGRCFEGVVLGLGLGAICERSGRRRHALRFIILDLAVVAQPLGFEVVGRPLVAQAAGLAVLGLRGEDLEVGPPPRQTGEEGTMVRPVFLLLSLRRGHLLDGQSIEILCDLHDFCNFYDFVISMIVVVSAIV